MSFRALRKAQREKEEQERLRQLEEEAQELEEQDDMRVSTVQRSAFAMLEDEDEKDDDQDEDDEQADESQPADTMASQPIPKQVRKKKKKKKKSANDNSASNVAATKDSTELDEIDAALRQLSTNGHVASTGLTTGGVDAAIDEANKLLAVDTSHLHAQNEMRRLFGRAALENEEEEGYAPPVGGNRRQQRRVQQAGLAQALRGQRPEGRSGLSVMALRRNIFIQGKEDWPMATIGGLAMEVEEKRVDGTVLYRFVHNTAYQDVQSQFEACVQSMDPDRMTVLLQHNPYHISTLLQVSEIAKSQRDHTTCGDLLERALFSFGRAVHSTFSKNLAEGKARLDFRRSENREFWLASWRYMQNLTMRATWRTIYEWAKLLLSLSPHDDPYALWLVLDQYALRSRQDLDFLNISRNKTMAATHQHMPNVQLSQALAEYRAGNNGKGRQALFTAVGKFPWVIARLLRELGLDTPPGVWGTEPRTEREKLHMEIYVTRAKDIWGTPENSNLLLEIASALPENTSAAAIDTSEITQNEARHVLLSDAPSLIALIPRSYTSQLTSASDPLPPDDAPDTVTTQASPRQVSTSANMQRAGDERLDFLLGQMRNLYPQLRNIQDQSTEEQVNVYQRWYDLIQQILGITSTPGAVNNERATSLFQSILSHQGTIPGIFGEATGPHNNLLEAMYPTEGNDDDGTLNSMHATVEDDDDGAL